MKTVEEIFKSKPELLKEKEVQELIEIFIHEYNNLRQKHFNYYDKVTEISLNAYFRENTKETLIKMFDEINEIPFNN